MFLLLAFVMLLFFFVMFLLAPPASLQNLVAKSSLINPLYIEGIAEYWIAYEVTICDLFTCCHICMYTIQVLGAVRPVCIQCILLPFSALCLDLLAVNKLDYQ